MIKINKDERITIRIKEDDKKEIVTLAEKMHLNLSQFINEAIKEKLEINKLNDSQSQFINLFDTAFKKSFEQYYKKIMVVQNAIDFNLKCLLKVQDIFMQQLKIPQTKEDLSISILPHPIIEKSQDLVLKDLRNMAERKRNLEDE